jgi:hypothetical protein
MEGETMKALSVRAPWTWAILFGKPVENRDWYTNVRGRILLHQSKFWRWNDICDDVAEIGRMASKDGITIPFPPIEDLQLQCGRIVGSVEIVDCVRQHPSAFFVGEWGFVLRNPKAFRTTIPFKGALGFFDVPDELLREERRKDGPGHE